MKKILIVAGTRPEIIKLAPILLTAKSKYSKSFDIRLCLTGQHKSMAEQALSIFTIKPSYDLNVMKAKQTLNQISGSIFNKLPSVLEDFCPDLVMIQGDTTTAAMAGIVSFNMNIPVAHVEAGLRTNNLQAPFPEELNRKLISTFARFSFAPTKLSEENLRKENVPEELIYITGNTVVDALEIIRNKFELNIPINLKKRIKTPFILVTAHRRESFGGGFRRICSAIKIAAEKYNNYQFVYPVHLNPNVKDPVQKMLGNIKNVLLMPPVSYIELLALLKNAEFCVTDSGGIQEESPSFNKKTIVLREVTERMESVITGQSVLVGTDVAKIVKNIDLNIKSKFSFNTSNPFGDGKASDRICTILINKL